MPWEVTRVFLVILFVGVLHTFLWWVGKNAGPPDHPTTRDDLYWWGYYVQTKKHVKWDLYVGIPCLLVGAVGSLATWILRLIFGP